MSNEERMQFYMNRNVKLYPALLALTWDVLFVWAISTLFFTQVKGLTYAQVTALDSVLMLSSCLSCFVALKLFKKVSPINTLRLSLLGYLAFVLIAIFAKTYVGLVIANVCLGFGFAAGIVKGNFILTEPLKMLKRGKEYQKIYGKGLAIYYVLEAVGAILATYIFSWNPYMVFWLAAAVIVLTILYTFLFKEPAKFQESNIKIDANVPAESKKVSSKSKSKKIKKISLFAVYLILFAFMLRGTLGVATSMFRIYLQEATDAGILPLWTFGYIYALSRIVIAFSNKFQFKFNLKFGVRTLILFYIVAVVAMVACGLIYIFAPFNLAMVILTIILSSIMCAVRPPAGIFINGYIEVCGKKENLETLYATRSTAEYLGHSLGALILSYLFTLTNGNYGYSMLIYIAIMGIPLLVSLILFIRELCKKYAEKYTIVKREYTEDDYT